MNIFYKELGRGTTFCVEKLFPYYVWSVDDNEHILDRSTNGASYAYGVIYSARKYIFLADVHLTHSTNQLVFSILNTETKSLIEIDGHDTFVFDLRPHSENEEGDEKGYDYRPQKDYGLHDYEKYDGCGLYATIKCLIIDLIESSLKSNSDDEV